MKTLLFCLLLVVCSAGCSSDQPEEEKTAIDGAVEATATEMVDRIQQPIDQARAAKALEDERMEQMQKQVD